MFKTLFIFILTHVPHSQFYSAELVKILRILMLCQVDIIIIIKSYTIYSKCNKSV